MDSEKKTLLCFDGLNWLNDQFWNNNADLQYCADPWEALRYSDHRVSTFVKAARNADFDLVVVIAGSSNDANAIAKYKWRREEEIENEKRGVCLGADMFLADSFGACGVRVVRPIGADAIAVLAALANSVENSVIVSKNRLFFSFDKLLLVSRSFTVKKGKLLLAMPVTRNDVYVPMVRSKRSFLSVQHHLALSHESWSLGLVSKYRPSLRSDGRVELGSSSSSDRRMGNLHVIARPLRAAVYSILGEQGALEKIPEWCKDKMVKWTETKVVADPDLISVLRDPLAVVEWLEKHDTPVTQLQPWRDAERHFNICCLAAELVAVSSDGNWTMHKCMEIFSKEADIIARTRAGANIAVEQKDGRNTFPNAFRNFATKTELAQQLQSSPSKLLPGIAKNENESSSSKSRVSIFGTGRSREEVLEEREHQNDH